MQPQASTMTVGTLVFAFFLTACSGIEGPAVAPDPFTLSGTVVDTAGRPLEGATVIIEPSLIRGQVVLTTGSDGTYRAESLPDTAYTVRAWKRVTYRGEKYCLRLGMPHLSDYRDFNVRNGEVRDFLWQLTGPIADAPDSSWHFGGLVRLILSGDFGEGTLELTLTPTDSRLDGSPASPLHRTLSLGSSSTLELVDVPVATYSVSGVLVQGANRREVHIGTTEEETFEEQSVTASLVFHPKGECVELNGVSQPYLFVNSPDDW